MYNAAELDKLLTNLISIVSTKKQKVEDIIPILRSLTVSIEKIPDQDIVKALTLKYDELIRKVYAPDAEIVYSDNEKRVLSKYVAYFKELLCGSIGKTATFVAGRELYKFRRTIYDAYDDEDRSKAITRFFNEESWLAINDTVFTVSQYLEFLNKGEGRSHIEQETGYLYWRFLCNPQAARAAKQVFKMRYALQIAYRLGWYGKEYASYCQYILRCLVACGKFTDKNYVPLGEAENVLLNYTPAAQSSEELTELFDNNIVEPDINDIRSELLSMWQSATGATKSDTGSDNND